MAFKWGSHSVVSVFIFASLLAARKYGLQSAFWRVYIRHVLNKTQTLSLPFIRACEECLSWVASCLRREHVFTRSFHKKFIRGVLFSPDFLITYDLVVSWKWQERHLYWLSHSIKTPEDCKTWFLVRLSFFKKGSIVRVGHMGAKEFMPFTLARIHLLSVAYNVNAPRSSPEAFKWLVHYIIGNL